MIQTSPGKAWIIAEKISKIDGVKIVYPVTGPYDVIAYLESKGEIVQLLKEVIAKIHSIKGVRRTLTAIAMH
ncbi:MAG: Lrp/AsnC ligand binding domain-containing protein [Candidatus Methanomethylicia archaeon]